MSVVLVASACGASGDTVSATSGTSDTVSATSGTSTDATPTSSQVSSTTAGTETTPPESVELPANPFPVTFESHATAAVTAEIGPMGGDISTESEGVTYTLTVPAGALFSTEMITMTPISLESSPLVSAEVLGVALEPDGLVLFEAASLEIEAEGLDRESTVFFSAGSHGEEFHLTFGEVAGTATVVVLHFSSAGLASAQQAEIDALMDDYRPSDRANRVINDLATLVRLIEDEQALIDGIDRLLEQSVGEVAADVDGETDPAALESLMVEFIPIVRILDHLAERDPPVALPRATEAAAAVATALQEAFLRQSRDANLRCIQERDHLAMWSMLRWNLLIHWLGAEGYGRELTRDEMRDSSDAIDRCMRVKVSFEGTVAGVVGEERSEFTATVNALFELRASFSIDLDRGLLISPVEEGTGVGSGRTSSPAGTYDCVSESIPIEVFLITEVRMQRGLMGEASFGDAAVSLFFVDDPSWECGGQTLGFQNTLWMPWIEFLFDGWFHADGDFRFPFRDVSHLPAEFVASNGTLNVNAEIALTLSHDPQVP